MDIRGVEMALVGKLVRTLAVSAALASAAFAVSAGTLDTVKKDKVIRLAVRADAPPFSYSAANGEPAGFMVDLCRAAATGIASQLNLDELKVEFVPVTADNRFDAITSGKADLLCEPTTATLSRREKVDFSIPTFVDGASLLVKGDGPRDLAALAGKKVGVLSGTTTEKDLRDTLANAKIVADVVPVGTHEEGLKQLEDGAVAAYFADRAILAFLAAKAPDASQLRLANDYLSIEPYGLALPRGDEDFRLAVDRALSHIYRSGAIAAVFARTFGAQMQPSDTIKTLYLVSALPD
jgi:ABC-type amino acid transport substrate-binding protein